MYSVNVCRFNDKWIHIGSARSYAPTYVSKKKSRVAIGVDNSRQVPWPFPS